MAVVAVYGTLREGQGNHRLLSKHAPALSTERVKGYVMYSAGGFPVIYKDPNRFITVELYEVDEETLTGPLDSLEGHPSWYRRELVDINGTQAWIYIMQRENYAQEDRRIVSGDWIKRGT